MPRVWETPAWRHKRMVEERARLAKQQALPVSETGSVKEEAERRARESALETDVIALSGLPEGEARNAKKRELLKIYLPAVEAYLNAGAIYANALLVRSMIWAFDVEEIVLADRLANVCILQGQPMPPMRRDLYAFIADSYLTWAEKQVKFGHSPEPYFSNSFKQVLDWVVPDMVKAKYCKFAAERSMEAEDWNAANDWYNKALTYNHKIQIQTNHDKVKKKITSGQIQMNESEKSDA